MNNAYMRIPCLHAIVPLFRHAGMRPLEINYRRMKNNQIRWLMILGALSIAGVLIVQIFWLRKAFDLRQSQFNYNVQVALKNVVESLCQFNGSDVPESNPIEQVSSNYFVVRTNDVIPPNSLEYFLKAELQKRTIDSDFEYTIYDCSNQNIVFSEYIDINTSEEQPKEEEILSPKYKENEYYFGVFFPHKTASIVNQMGIWVFSSSALFIVIIFFTLALFVIFRQKRLSEIQRDFVNNMAHEFKTPISTISLASDYLSKPEASKSPEKLSNYASIIQKENNRLMNQVERVLQIAKPEKATILQLQEVDLFGVITEAREHLKLMHQETPIEFEINNSFGTLMVKADKMHLHNAIYNLIDNGVKYCNRNPKITLDILEKSKQITLEISDNGIGIPGKYQKLIFQRFFRVPKGDQHDVKGFGIGLFYVKMILKKMNGSIRLVHSDDSGSKFQLKIPAA